MKTDALEQLLRSQPGLWRGSRSAGPAGPVLATGFPELDAVLPGGGWPVGALLEISAPCLGVGELRVLLPAMAATSQAGRWIAWVAPPHLPYAPALVQAGVDLRRVLLVDAQDTADIPWSLEKLLRSGRCGMALAWPRQLADHQIRRLQLAAAEDDALAVLFLRPGGGAGYAALRLAVQPVQDGLSITILKARGSLCRESLILKG